MMDNRNELTCRSCGRVLSEREATVYVIGGVLCDACYGEHEDDANEAAAMGDL